MDDPLRLDADDSDGRSERVTAAVIRPVKPKRRFHVMAHVPRRPPKKPTQPVKREPSPPSSAQTRVRNTAGRRALRSPPLTADDLYLTADRPPVTAPRNGHKCQICQLVKSNPVEAGCGHSYCYVCIRLRLEREWTCPYTDCGRKIRIAPLKDRVSAEAIAFDYDTRVDKSRVSYSWQGLDFPVCPRPIYVSSSPPRPTSPPSPIYVSSSP
ncbi:hypothetical protein R3P38DRAFT_3201622 [Favolaschia claudopus]|uniref:RING-type domain-containing protein n=1 Tax=Favolaschia claudopus TaxID=2862362 RepID=A0AAW0AXC2_9AGAR